MTSSFAFYDVDGGSDGASSNQWLRVGSLIAAATGATFTMVAAVSDTTSINDFCYHREYDNW